MSRFYTGLLLLSAVLLSLFSTEWSSSANALGFHSKKKNQDAQTVQQLQTYQPPPVNSLQVRCDPIKQEIVLMNHKPLLLKPFFIPRKQWLITRHEQCVHRVIDQEYIYLKHVDIQQAPQLPKMTTPDGKPVAMPLENGESSIQPSEAAPSSKQPEPAQPTSQSSQNNAH
jgi:hypothetical protein